MRHVGTAGHEVVGKLRPGAIAVALGAVFVILFVMATLMAPVDDKAVFDGAKGWSIANFDWLFMVGGNIFVLFCLALIVLPVGKVRIGGEDAKPEFSVLSWFAMLFAAGMGIGLMFWSVAEPTAYYTNWFGTPLNAVKETEEGARVAMGATMFHWGLHPWAIYAVVALALVTVRVDREPSTATAGAAPAATSTPSSRCPTRTSSAIWPTASTR
mgnify:CR=1 FL=1